MKKNLMTIKKELKFFNNYKTNIDKNLDKKRKKFKWLIYSRLDKKLTEL